MRARTGCRSAPPALRGACARSRSAAARRPARRRRPPTCAPHPSIGSSKQLAAITPSPATCAMARSMNTMPRDSTCCPSGTCEIATSTPAISAGHRMLKSVSIVFIWRRQQLVERVVEQAEQILRLGRAADRERQHHGRRVHALGQPVRRLRIVVGVEQDQLRRRAGELRRPAARDTPRSAARRAWARSTRLHCRPSQWHR